MPSESRDATARPADRRPGRPGPRPGRASSRPGASTPSRSTSPRRPRCARGGRRARRRRRPRRRRPAGARGHRHHPRGRRPGRRAGRPDPGRPGRGLPGLGDAAARAALAPLATRSAGGWRCCAGSPTPTDDAARGPLRVVVAPVRSVLQPQLKGLGDLEPVELATGGDGRPRRGGRARLADLAYARVDLVTKRGEFAVRGGILDVFPPTDEHPLRVEFWGDEVEEIRTFAVADQRTIDKVDRLWAPPCRELLLTADVRARAAALAAASTRSWPRCWTSWPRASRSRAWSRSPRRCSTARDSLELLLDCMPAGTARAAVRPGADPHPGARPGPYQRGVPAGRAGPRPPAAARRRSTSARPRSRPSPRYARPPRDLGQPWWSVSPFGVAEAEPDRAATTSRGWRASWTRCPTSAPDEGRALALSAQPVPLYHGETGRVVDDLEALGRRRLARGAGLRGARPGQARGRGAARRRPRRRAGRRRRRRAAAGRGRWSPRGALEHGFVDEAARLARAHRHRHLRRPGRVHQGHAQDAEPAAQHDRPAGAAGRRLRRARAARHRPVRRAGAAHGQRRRARVPGHRVRGEQARPARRPALRADRPARPAVPLRRRRDTRRCTRWAARTGRRPRPRARKAVREIAAQLIQLYAARQTLAGPRVRPGHPVAARAGGRVPLHGDARTSCPRSRRSRPTWRSRSRWTG